MMLLKAAIVAQSIAAVGLRGKAEAATGGWPWEFEACKLEELGEWDYDWWSVDPPIPHMNYGVPVWEYVWEQCAHPVYGSSAPKYTYCREGVWEKKGKVEEVGARTMCSYAEDFVWHSQGELVGSCVRQGVETFTHLHDSALMQIAASGKFPLSSNSCKLQPLMQTRHPSSQLHTVPLL